MRRDGFERLKNTSNRVGQRPVGAILVIALNSALVSENKANTRFAPTG